MSETAPTPDFVRPPIVETVIGVQFTPLQGFRSHHYGWLWREFLSANGWNPVADEKPLPEYVERFDDIHLKLTRPDVSSASAFKVRLKLKSPDRSRTIQVQPDKFYFSWAREDSCTPGYAVARPEFDRLFDAFQKFADTAGVGAIQPNLWEVMYVNQIPPGKLWSEPKDWHRILPTLFPASGPTCEGIRFASYHGEWHFEIEPRRGRIHLRIAKMVMNQRPDPVLLINLTARGQIDSEGDWATGLDLGHDACVRLFCEITSDEAQREWKGLL